MRFMKVKDLPLDEIAFLRGRYKIISSVIDGEDIYEVDDELRDELKVLEKAGFVKIIKGEIHDIEKAEDLLSLTERVEIVEGGSLFLRVQLAGHTLSFTEDQLLTPTALRKYLLRIGKVLSIKQKEWNELLQYWLDIGERVSEVSEDEEVVDKFLNYIGECRVVKDTKEAVLPYVLLMKDGSVYCSTDTIAEKLGMGKRKLRSVLSDYIVGNSVQFRIYDRRHRFWQLSVDKCGINLEKQLAEEVKEEEEEVKEEDDKEKDWEEAD